MGGFAAIGDQTHLFLFGGSFKRAWLAGLEHTQISSPLDFRPLRLLRYALGAMSAIERWNPDAIICSDATTVQIAWIGRLLSGRRHLPIASWIHFPLSELRFKRKLRYADLHLAISRQMALDLGWLLPRRRDRIAVTMNAIETLQARLIARPPSARFIYMGRLNFNDHKRVNDILLAAGGLRGEWSLKLIGAPLPEHRNHESKLRALAAELGIEHRIEWLGWRAEPWDAVGDVTALISSSAREAFGMVLIEAFSHGIFCISSACSGPLEIVEPGVNGWLYPIADIAALAAQMQRLVDQPLTLPPQHEIRDTISRFAADRVALETKIALQKVSEEMA